MRNFFTRAYFRFFKTRTAPASLLREPVNQTTYSGSSFDLTKLQVDVSLPPAELVRSLENQIAGAAVEVGLVFSVEGQLLVKRVGKAGNIRFSGDELEKMKDNILTHNHPQRGYFSREDVFFAHEFNLAELRAVAGKKVYRLLRPAGGWDLARLEKMWDSEERKVFHLYNQNKIRRDDANSRLNQLAKVVVKRLSLETKLDML